MGQALKKRREEFLADFTEGSGPKRVLLLGDGDGRFLAALLSTNPAGEVDTVDSSAEMLRLARRRIRHSAVPNPKDPRVKFHHANALSWLPSAGCVYDAVVTHFFLDCLTESEIDALLVRLRPFLAPAATWTVSDFHQPLHGLAAWRSRVWIGVLYRFFRWTTGLSAQRLPNYRFCLESSGFCLEKQVLANHGLLISERWRLGSDDDHT